MRLLKQPKYNLNCIIIFLVQAIEADPCNPSPCGANAQCNNGICTCLPEYQGDPYRGCRPECVLNSDCSRTQACLRNKCKNPCPGTCGTNAVCNVNNHIPMCTCIEGYTGNAFILCSPIPRKMNFIPTSILFTKIFGFSTNKNEPMQSFTLRSKQPV